MCCKSFWTKIVPFTLTLILGLLAANIFQKQSSVNKNQESSSFNIQKNALGGGIDSAGNQSFDKAVGDKFINESVRVISKPTAKYTDAARQNQLQGSVTLRVTFLANGKIGNVSPLNTLPDGLTEQAIAAAKAIEFEPAKTDGVPHNVIKLIQYSFSLY